SLTPDLAGAWLGRGNVFTELQRYDEAFAAYHNALSLKPDLAGALIGCGRIFSGLQRPDEALTAYDKALSLNADFAEAWLGRGNALRDLQRYDEAFAAYDKALILNPDSINTEGMRLLTKIYICDWMNFDNECAHLISSGETGRVNKIPYALLAISSSSDNVLQCAKLWITEKHPPSQKAIWRGERYRHDRIRVAYVSADFREHPTSYLMAGVFECHDKSQFE